MRRNLKRSAPLVAAFAALALLSACGSDDGGSGVSANEDGSTSITIATVGSDSGSQAFYAEKQGFFEDNGLDVTVKIVANVPELAAAVESGDAQFALTSPTSVASANAAGIGFQIVAGGAVYKEDNPGVWVMVPKGSDITDVKGLAGKSIAVNALNTMPHLSTLATLDDAGVDIDKINFVTLDFTQVGQAFESGQVDAATVTAPFNAQIEADGLGSVLTVPYDAVNDRQDFYNTIWFGQRSLVEENPELIEKFQAAIADTNAWANDEANEDERKQILQEYTNLTDESVATLQLLQFGDEATEEMLQPVIDVMSRFNVLPKPVEATDIIAQID
ncbi:ABC transporter substrate-binding protein [Nocardioides massiliensis]|uniref:NitT/TauT family transport system substrate-binding protein n=1 Tax=Nocardioides massiliensis TaxID=1325935 RepID=A0ABT9NN33_9ACTN|nr:ABC transporter substrate-binding protein [Nocardioides massiliensis]MDP9821829.1 NitT/TauT family transport system substrate-binding protein [Nocardioides massiliensis]